MSSTQGLPAPLALGTRSKGCIKGGCIYGGHNRAFK